MTTASALVPVVARPGEDRAPVPIQLDKHQLIVKLCGKDTGDNFSLAVLRAEPMSGPPLHIHTREDEWFYILKGEFTFQVGEQRFTAGPGTSVFAPRDIPHTWQNLTNETIEAIGMVTPSGIEGFFLEMTQLRTPEEAPGVMERYGILMVGPPIAQ